jgi:hypothetical protein
MDIAIDEKRDIALEDELKTLIQQKDGPCVSIFMPTHRAGLETQQDPVRFKNLIRQALDKLVEGDMRLPEAQALLAPANDLLDDNFLWRHQSEGLALFVSPEIFRYYRVPLSLAENTVVNSRFHLKPLLPLLGSDGNFYILALSQKDVRMLECTRYSIKEIKLEGVPKSLDEALKYDEREKQLQYHTASGGGRRDGSLMFHGHAASEPKKDILRYFQKVDEGLSDMLKYVTDPIILAGVDYLLPIYREANTYGNLLAESIAGNPEGLSDEELHQQGWPLVQSHFQKAREEALARYFGLAGSGLASSDIREIVAAAYFGRVDAIFVSTRLGQWGAFDPETGEVQVHEDAHPGDDDLVDLAAVHTFLNRGAIFAVEPEDVPGGGPVAATFRY